MDEYNDLVVDIGYYNHRARTPAWIIKKTTINFVDVTYVVGGQAEYTVDDETFAVSAGDLLCIQSGSSRTAVSSPDDPIEAYCVNGQVRDLSGRDVPMPLPRLSHIGLHPDIISLYGDLTAAWLLRDPGYGFRARATYMLILQRFFQMLLYHTSDKKYDNRLAKALRHITEHYAEPLTVRGMAQMSGLSPLYFGDFFRRETGMSFRQYLTSIRLNRAEDLLYSGEHTVNEVATACGFSDIFYFSKVFKEHRGISPSQFMRAGRG
ncbi:MAG: AraC family transcriptional regulator [Oscillospiraceae bacterium]|nr:AraC family transcriptional regulator [Oscillospiraceae bacterium]